jgi:macrolide-specific efflux system membrane fusion protein
MAQIAQKYELKVERGSTPPRDTTQDRPARRRFVRRHKGLIGLTVIAVIALCLWGSYISESKKPIFVTEAVSRGDIEDSVTAAGTLSPISDVDVGAQTSGQLKTVKVSIGDKVQKGSLLAEIDPAPLETQIEINDAELSDLEAQLKDKEAQLVFREADLVRQRSLASQSSGTQSALETATAALATAQAALQSLNAQNASRTPP